MLKCICLTLLLVGTISCEASTNDKTTESIAEQGSDIDGTLGVDSECINLINTVYDKFVFAIDSDNDVIPETYFTSNALKMLQDDYEFDCDEVPCYAYYALRTEAQDSKPGSDETSRIYSIDPVGEGWYIVSFSDMGWPGKTRIKIVDGKIDSYERMDL